MVPRTMAFAGVSPCLYPAGMFFTKGEAYDINARQAALKHKQRKQEKKRQLSQSQCVGLFLSGIIDDASLSRKTGLDVNIAHTGPHVIYIVTSSRSRYVSSMRFHDA